MEIADQEKYFESWIDSHMGIVVKVCRSFSSQEQDFEDLLQDILFQIWKSIPAFKGNSSSSTWIYRVALNRALIWRRAASRHRDTVRILGEERSLFYCRSDARDERIDALYAAVRKLTKTDRALVLLALDGLSYREIAAIADITESNVGVRLSRVRKKLHKLMEKDAL